MKVANGKVATGCDEDMEWTFREIVEQIRKGFICLYPLKLSCVKHCNHIPLSTTRPHRPLIFPSLHMPCFSPLTVYYLTFYIPHHSSSLSPVHTFPLLVCLFPKNSKYFSFYPSFNNLVFLLSLFPQLLTCMSTLSTSPHSFTPYVQAISAHSLVFSTLNGPVAEGNTSTVCPEGPT